MSTSPSPNDLTRQQLDELDALLQRMLSLPLNNPPAAPPVPTPTEVPVPTGVSGAWRTDGPVSGGRSPYLASQSMPAVGQHGAIAPELDRPPPPEADWGPDPLARYNVDPARLFGPASHESGVMPSTVRGVDAPALPMDYQPAIAEEPVAVTSTEEPAELAPLAQAPFTFPGTAPPEPPPPSIPVLAWPLYGVNWVLESLLGLLGPFGAAARHPAVKHPLGWVGILLLVSAGVWAARGMGWIELPVPSLLTR